MLKEISFIKNLGLLRNATCSDYPFDKATLIYAENGRGKSTLASIFRACALGDAASLHLRKTIDSEDVPQVKLKFEDNQCSDSAIFNKNIWSSIHPEILVFDSNFVEKNVYSGTVIRAEQRQGLLEFALGIEAVQLKQNVESAMQKASESNSIISTTEKALSGYMKGMPIKDFVALPSILNVDEQLQILRKRINEAKTVDALKKITVPSLITEPNLDVDKFFEILSRQIEDIENNAETLVRDHISSHTQPNFEDWLSQGQSFGNGETCPYCQQSIVGSSLITDYRTYFNEEYIKHIKTVTSLLKIEERLSAPIFEQLANKVIDNQNIANKWEEYIGQHKFTFDKEAVIILITQLRELLCNLAQAKQRNPLEAIISEESKEKAKTLWYKLLSEVKNCNLQIALCVNAVEIYKANLSVENIKLIQSQIESLELTKVRYQQEICDLVQQWSDARISKRQYDKEKTDVRNKLDALMTQTLQKYQTQINSILIKFDVAFEITELGHAYQGDGKPRSKYGLKVRKQDIELSAEDSPSFATALSEGDKRTLAFAFFIACIEADPNLNDKIVVVDDPVCSLDLNRRNMTKRILRNIGIKSAQLIVLSHDPYFLSNLRDALKKVKIPMRLLKLTTVEHGYSNFSALEIDDECESSYHKRYKLVSAFVNGKKACDHVKVSQAIRPLLEKYLHFRFPEQIVEGTLFGNIVGEIKKAQSPNPLVYLQPLANELNEINDYVGEFHHDANSSGDSGVIIEAELRSYAKRALTIIYKGSPLA